MKSNISVLALALFLLAGAGRTIAQNSGFFRISGPAATSILALRPDGSLVWSNAQAGATYRVQTVGSLPGQTNWVDYVWLNATQAVNTNLILAFNPPPGMALIPEGPFMMGDTLDGESDALPTNVTVSAFYMDTNLVSLSQWQAVYAWATGRGYVFNNPGAGKAANHPVESVDWYDCVKWGNARSQQAGLTPVYYLDAGHTQVYRAGDNGTTVYADWGANGYRLPTEAEWEKAARGGATGLRFPWGNTISWSQANYFGYPGSLGGYPYDLATATDYDPAYSGGDNGDYPYTSPVGSFAPNGYGLFDMAGNVLQWCWDWYAFPPYPTGSPYLGGTDPHGPTGPLSNQALRGGLWFGYAYVSRCAFRYCYDYPDYSDNYIGLRCVRGL